MGRRQDWTPVGVLSCVVGAGLSQSPRVKSLRGVGAFFLRMCAFVLSFLLRPMGAMRGSSARTGPLAVGSLGVAPDPRGGGIFKASLSVAMLCVCLALLAPRAAALSINLSQLLPLSISPRVRFHFRVILLYLSIRAILAIASSLL